MTQLLNEQLTYPHLLASVPNKVPQLDDFPSSPPKKMDCSVRPVSIMMQFSSVLTAEIYNAITEAKKQYHIACFLVKMKLHCILTFKDSLTLYITNFNFVARSTACTAFARKNKHSPYFCWRRKQTCHVSIFPKKPSSGLVLSTIENEKPITSTKT